MLPHVIHHISKNGHSLEFMCSIKNSKSLFIIMNGQTLNSSLGLYVTCPAKVNIFSTLQDLKENTPYSLPPEYLLKNLIFIRKS